MEIAGFKSFRDKTILDFSDGISAIVGPNGCGKSNIVDAVRWVMGEQRIKTLRAKNMGDIIFSGSNGASPVGMAEVSMTLSSDGKKFPGDYSDYSEIMVSRRIFRDSESEYYINKVPCRLLDVKELFMDMGIGARTYSLVEQNRIANLIEARPSDRRNFIEEAAGIVKYKTRKEAASRKMESTRQNIVRLNDIIREVKSQLNSRSQQAKKAERYKTLRKAIKEAELTLALQTYSDLTVKRKSLREAYDEILAVSIEAETRLREIETFVEKIKTDILENDALVSKLQESLYGIKNGININEREIEFSRGKITEISVRKQKNLSEIGMLQNREKDILEELKIIQDGMTESDGKIEDIRSSIAKNQKRSEELKEKEVWLRKELEKKKIEHFDILTEQVRLKNVFAGLVKRREEFKRKLESYCSEIDENTRRIKLLSDSLSSGKSSLQSDIERFEYLRKEEKRLFEKLEKARSNLRSVDEKIVELKEAIGMKSSRLSSLQEFQEGYEWCNEGTKSIMKTKTARDGVDYEQIQDGFCGLVVDYIDVPEEYEVAVEAVLGEMLQSIVIRKKEDGVRAIDYLKGHLRGRGSFVPVEEIRKKISGVDKNLPDVRKAVKLIDLIMVKEDFKDIADYLFGDVMLIPDINMGISLWSRNGFDMTFVTPDGDIVCPHGVLKGGYESRDDGTILRRKREIAQLREETDKLTNLLKNEKDYKLRIAALVSQCDKELAELKSDLRKLELNINSKRKDVERFEGERKWIEQRINVLAFNRENQRTEEVQVREKSVAIEKDIASCREREIVLNKEISSLQVRWEELRGKLDEMEKELTGEKVLLASLVEKKNASLKTLARVRAAATDISTEINAKTDEVKKLEEEIEDITENIARERNHLEHLYSDIDMVKIELEGKRELQREKNDILRNTEIKAREAKEAFDKLTRDANELDMESRALSSQISVLKEGMLRKYHVDLDSLKAGFKGLDESGIQELKNRLDRDRKTIENFGEVNLLALGEYEKLKERYDFLTFQVEDLNSSLHALQRTMSKINRISRERFSETFTAVNRNFKEVFSRLFQGGRGELRLTDESNMLETGVDIDIQLPGKKLRNIALLSGGEKSLAAVALIFSILLYRPAPFLVLDEVDAALDDANVLLLNNLIKDISSNSQIIMVTHNKNSMEVADSLVGITMEKDGVSTVVSVNLN